MNKWLAGWIGLALVAAAPAETFTVDTGHAEVGFAIKHMMVSNTKGTFKTFGGTLEYDIATKTLKSAKGFIEVASIDTNNEKRDKHLKNKDFFNISKFPKMTFKTTAVKKTGKNTFEVTGTLNVLGVDRKVVLPVTITGPVDDPWGNKRIGIACNTTLNRRDLGITHSSSATIGDKVKISIEVEATFK